MSSKGGDLSEDPIEMTQSVILDKDDEEIEATPPPSGKPVNRKRKPQDPIKDICFLAKKQRFCAEVAQYASERCLDIPWVNQKVYNLAKTGVTWMVVQIPIVLPFNWNYLREEQWTLQSIGYLMTRGFRIKRLKDTHLNFRYLVVWGKKEEFEDILELVMGTKPL
jgi:hypothetical protein